jgi:hypothetical protein
MTRFLRFALAAVLLISSAWAQRQMAGPGGSARGSFSSARFAGHRTSIRSGREHRAFASDYGYYGLPYFYSDDYQPYDWQYQSVPPEPPASPSPAAQAKVEPLPDPVLLELRGSQWIRVTNYGEAAGQAVDVEKSTEQPGKIRPIPPALLVFRDGHTEEVSSYSIIGGSIYTKANYWTSGAWTRTIAIADLDIPNTLNENQKRGVNFELPSGPDEVMLRP